MAAGALLLMGTGGLLSSYGQYIAGQAENQAAQMNAQIAEENAISAVQQAAQDERAIRVQGRKVLGEMRASYGASGVTVEGSPLDVLKESAANIELDALNTRYAGEAKAIAFRNEARLERYRGEFAETAGRIGAASSLLMTGGNIASKMPAKSGNTGSSDSGGWSGSSYYTHTDSKWKRMV